jgi:ribosome-binding protein aMBF1 (putative translation factor)
MAGKNLLGSAIELRGLSARQLAKNIDVGHSRILAWMEHGANPTLKNSIKLAKALNISLDELAIVLGYDPNN